MAGLIAGLVGCDHRSQSIPEGDRFVLKESGNRILNNEELNSNLMVLICQTILIKRHFIF